jgi:hypothetical protein
MTEVGKYLIGSVVGAAAGYALGWLTKPTAPRPSWVEDYFRAESGWVKDSPENPKVSYTESTVIIEPTLDFGGMWFRNIWLPSLSYAEVRLKGDGYAKATVVVRTNDPMTGHSYRILSDELAPPAWTTYNVNRFIDEVTGSYVDKISEPIRAVWICVSGEGHAIEYDYLLLKV